MRNTGLITDKPERLTPHIFNSQNNVKCIRGAGLTKQQIRSKILSALKIQKEEDRERKSNKIKKKLFRNMDFKKAKVVMFYIATSGEVNTDCMIEEARKLGKKICVPVCKNRAILRPCKFEENSRLKKGPYGICEPEAQKRVGIEDLDLVIAPGVAFDKNGNRLGRGKGCFDRFLKKIPKDTPTIGLAFDFQILPQIPAAKHDVNIKKVIFA